MGRISFGAKETRPTPRKENVGEFRFSPTPPTDTKDRGCGPYPLESNPVGSGSGIGALRLAAEYN